MFCFLHYYWTEERNVADTPKEEAANVKFTDILSVFKKNRAFLALCIHGVCICCMQYVGSTLGTYMYSDVLGNIGIMSLASVVSMPLSIVALLIMPSSLKIRPGKGHPHLSAHRLRPCIWACSPS